MNKNQPLRQQLEAIQAQDSFEELTSFCDPTTWKNMSLDDRELLGLLFIRQAEKQLELGDSNVLNSIHMATRAAPDSAEVYFRQGLLYLTQDQNVRCMIEAVKSFQRSVQIDPEFCISWKSWGDSLIKLGLLNEDAQSFFEAVQVYMRGESCLLKHVEEPEKRAAYYWNWGLASFFLGRHSEEASDYIQALAKYRETETLGCDAADFYFDYGRAYVELGGLMQRPEYLQEGVRYFKESLVLDSESFPTLMALGMTYQQLFEVGFDPDHYTCAKQCFEQAATMQPEEPSVWTRWGILDLLLAKITQDLEFLSSAHKKFSTANTYDKGNSLILSHWADTEILLGGRTENLDLLNDAKQKIIRCVEEYPENHHFWYLYGICLYELAQYFGGEALYQEAMGKLNHALSLKPEFTPAWHGKAMATVALAELKNDSILLDRALRFFLKAHELGLNSPGFLNDWAVALMKLAEMTRDAKLLEMAIDRLERAINGRTLDGEGLGPDPEWLYNLGCCYDFYADITGNAQFIEKAIQLLQHVVENEPKFYAARYNLALSFAHLGEVTGDVDILKQSLEQFEEYLRNNPEDDGAWNDCGLMLLDLAHLVRDPVLSSDHDKLLQQAELKLHQAVCLGCQEALFNMACVQSMMGQGEAAIHFLQKSETAGMLPHFEELLLEPWLETLRDTPAFKEFIHYLRAKDNEKG